MGALLSVSRGSRQPAKLIVMNYRGGKAKAKPIAQGLPASPGAATGIVVFDADRAEIMGKEQGHKVILVREETSPEDIRGMAAALGILTQRGGQTSHAALVAVDARGDVAALLHSINTVLWGENGIFVDGVSIPDAAAFDISSAASIGPTV